jgi:hypothetical protein
MSPVDRFERIGIIGHAAQIVVVAHVAAPLLLRHRGMEALAVEIGRHDGMTVGLERVDDRAK